MAIQGLRDTSGFTVTGQRPENWREGTLLLFPNGKFPLTALTAVMRSESVDDPKFHWYEKVMSDQRLKLNQDVGVLDPETLVFVSGAYECRIGTLLLMEDSGEVVIVTTAPASDTDLIVARSWGTVAATVVDHDAAGKNPYVTVVGTAVEEGSSAPTAIAYDPTEHWNYLQIFRNTLNATRTAINTHLRTGDQVREAKREALQFHNIEKERSFWFGERAMDTHNGKPRRTMEGFFPWMTRLNSSRVITVGDGSNGILDLDELEEHLKTAFEYGSTEKVAFCGNRALLTVQQVIRKNSNAPYTLIQGQKEFGMNVSRLVCPSGELILKNHPLWNRMASGVTAASGYAGVDSWMAIIDMESPKYRYLKNSDTAFKDNIQANDVDAKQAGYLAECGIEWHHSESHLVLKNLSSAKADA